MKLLYLFAFVVLLLAQNINAQNIDEKKGKIKAHKVAFITSEIGLTSDEAGKFWPIYNQFDQSQFELRHTKMKAFQRRMKDGSVNNMTEKEASAFLAQLEATENELYELRKKLNSDLRKVISPIKIIKLKKAEDDFNRKLLQQYRSKKK